MIDIYSITTAAERNKLSELAKEVPNNGCIVEIGALYGGVTAVLGLAAPNTRIYAIDNFSWHPENMPVTSKALLLDNMKSIGVKNVLVLEMTSKEAMRNWNRNIDLLWIDGGHDFKTVYFDLYNFSMCADVIAMHDYRNILWPDIEQAVKIFLSADSNWRISEVVDQLVVLRKRK